MAKNFLKAEWKNLIMANYEIDAAVLHSYCHPTLNWIGIMGRYLLALSDFYLQIQKCLD
jgi:hypothetical protein